MDKLPWPLVTITLEASSLDARSYPIEVGICRWDAPEQPLQSWSTLIKPTQAWRTRGSWSTAAQAAHHIARDELDAGLSPHETALVLDSLIGGSIALCAGGQYDHHWRSTLYRAAGSTPDWRLADWDGLTGMMDQMGYMDMLRWMERRPARHSARYDAERLMQAVAIGMQLPHTTSQQIEMVR